MPTEFHACQFGTQDRFLLSILAIIKVLLEVRCEVTGRKVGAETRGVDRSRIRGSPIDSSINQQCLAQDGTTGSSSLTCGTEPLSQRNHPLIPPRRGCCYQWQLALRSLHRGSFGGLLRRSGFNVGGCSHTSMFDCTVLQNVQGCYPCHPSEPLHVWSWRWRPHSTT